MNAPAPTTSVFDVHLFAVVRVKVHNLSAASHAAAIEQAVRQQWDSLKRRYQVEDAEFTEEFSYFLVDQVGDTDYRHSRGYFPKQDPRITLLAELLGWYDADTADDDRLETIVAKARKLVDESL